MGVFEIPEFADGHERDRARGRRRERHDDRRAAAIRSRRSIRRASPIASRTFRPAAARRSSFWAAELPGVEALTDKE